MGKDMNNQKLTRKNYSETENCSQSLLVCRIQYFKGGLKQTKPWLYTMNFRTYILLKLNQVLCCTYFILLEKRCTLFWITVFFPSFLWSSAFGLHKCALGFLYLWFEHGCLWRKLYTRVGTVAYPVQCLVNTMW